MDKYNSWVNLYSQYMNAYYKYIWDKKFNDTVDLRSYIGDTNYSMLGEYENIKNLDITKPNLRDYVVDEKLEDFANEDFFDGFEDILDEKIEEEMERYENKAQSAAKNESTGWIAPTNVEV